MPTNAPTIDALAAYAETDLLCYRAVAPEPLVQRQARLWQPWLDWAALTFDAKLRTTAGLAYVKQHHDSIAALRAAVTALDIDAIAGLGIAVPALGSLVLGLALARRAPERVDIGGLCIFSLSLLPLLSSPFFC